MSNHVNAWHRYLVGLRKRAIWYWRILPFILLFLFVLHGYTLEQRLTACYPSLNHNPE